MNKITESIWLGNSTDARTPNGMDAILNCAFDLACPYQWGTIYSAHCGLTDGPGNPMSAYYSAVAQLGALLRMGKKVLVYCHDGYSRSAAVVMMYLHATDGLQRGWDYWRQFVHERRPLPDNQPHPAHRNAFHNLDWLIVQAVTNTY